MLEQQEPSSPTPRGSTSKNPYTSPLTVVQQFISENKQLIELNVIYISFHSPSILLYHTTDSSTSLYTGYKRLVTFNSIIFKSCRNKKRLFILY